MTEPNEEVNEELSTDELKSVSGGEGGTSFGPSYSLTREQFSKMAELKYDLKSEDHELDFPEQKNKYPDWGKTRIGNKSRHLL